RPSPAWPAPCGLRAERPRGHRGEEPSAAAVGGIIADALPPTVPALHRTPPSRLDSSSHPWSTGGRRKPGATPRRERTLSAFDLKGRVAVVTGGNGGIGLGMARGMAAAGAAIVVAGRNREKSARAVTELEGLGARAVAIEVDVTDEASVTALVRAAAERWGRLDVLVNNAGTNIRKQPQE